MVAALRRPVGVALACVAWLYASGFTFVPAPGSPVPVDSYDQLLTGEFDGDNHLDLVAGWRLATLLGKGSGAFAPVGGDALIDGSRNTTVVADFNGDSRDDLAVADFDSESAWLLLGKGAGHFTRAPAPAAPVGRWPSAAAAADVDENGHPDLLVADERSDEVTVLLGDGAGGFYDAPPVDTGDGPDAVLTGEFNGDGHADLAVANAGSDDVSILLGDGHGLFVPAPGSPFRTGGEAGWVAVGDLNGDGRQDLVVGGPDISVMLGDGAGRLAHAPGSPIRVGSESDSAVVADLDGDHHDDVAVLDRSDKIWVMRGDGSGRFVSAAGSPLRASRYADALAAGDFNGDGRQDLAVNGRAGISILISGPGPPASARISGTSSCRRDTAQATVRGRRIASVLFTVGGHRAATLRLPNAPRTGYRYQTRLSSLRGEPAIRARISFTTASASRLLTLRVPRCAGRGLSETS